VQAKKVTSSDRKVEKSIFVFENFVIEKS